MPHRYFDLDEAQALIPQIRLHMQSVLQLHAHLRGALDLLDEAGYEIEWNMLRGDVELDDDASEDDRNTLARGRMLYRALRESVTAVEDTGAEVKGVIDGLVDFRSWQDGVTEVYLCWRMGEPRIDFFHGVDDGFAGRKPLGDHSFRSRRHGEESLEDAEESRVRG